MCQIIWHSLFMLSAKEYDRSLKVYSGMNVCGTQLLYYEKSNGKITINTM